MSYHPQQQHQSPVGGGGQQQNQSAASASPDVTKFNLLMSYVFGDVRLPKLPTTDFDIITLWRKMEEPYNNTVNVFRWSENLEKLESRHHHDDRFHATTLQLMKSRFAVITVIFNSLFSSPIFPFHDREVDSISNVGAFFERLRQEQSTTTGVVGSFAAEQWKNLSSQDVDEIANNILSGHANNTNNNNNENTSSTTGGLSKFVMSSEHSSGSGSGSGSSNSINAFFSSWSSHPCVSIFLFRVAFTVQMINLAKELHDSIFRLDAFGFLDSFIRATSLRNTLHRVGTVPAAVKPFRLCPILTFSLKLCSSSMARGFLVFFQELGAATSMLCLDLSPAMTATTTSSTSSPNVNTSSNIASNNNENKINSTSTEKNQNRNEDSESKKKQQQQQQSTTAEPQGLMSRFFGAAKSLIGGGSSSSSSTTTAATSTSTTNQPSASTNTTTTSNNVSSTPNTGNKNENISPEQQHSPATTNQQANTSTQQQQQTPNQNKTINEEHHREGSEQNKSVGDNANNSGNKPQPGESGGDGNERKTPLPSNPTTSTTPNATTTTTTTTAGESTGSSNTKNPGESLSSPVPHHQVSLFTGSQVFRAIGSESIIGAIHNVVHTTKSQLPGNLVSLDSRTTQQQQQNKNTSSSPDDSGKSNENDESNNNTTLKSTTPIPPSSTTTTTNAKESENLKAPPPSSSTPNPEKNSTTTTTTNTPNKNPTSRPATPHSQQQQSPGATTTKETETTNKASTTTTTKEITNVSTPVVAPPSTNIITGPVVVRHQSFLLVFYRDTLQHPSHQHYQHHHQQHRHQHQQQHQHSRTHSKSPGNPSSSSPTTQQHHQQHQHHRVCKDGSLPVSKLTLGVESQKKFSLRAILSGAWINVDDQDEKLRQKMIDFVLPMIESSGIQGGMLASRESSSLQAVARGEFESPDFCFAVVSSPSNDILSRDVQNHICRDLANRLNQFIGVWNRENDLSGMSSKLSQIRVHSALNSLF